MEPLRSYSTAPYSTPPPNLSSLNTRPRRYVTTGDVPPGCGTGGSFVHDPKMAREAAVKGQVKMQFVVGKTSYVVVRWVVRWWSD